MYQLSYRPTFGKKQVCEVCLDGKQVGRIIRIDGKYQYTTLKGGHKGDLFDTLSACQKSLESK